MTGWPGAGVLDLAAAGDKQRGNGDCCGGPGKRAKFGRREHGGEVQKTEGRIIRCAPAIPEAQPLNRRIAAGPASSLADAELLGLLGGLGGGAGGGRDVVLGQGGPCWADLHLLSKAEVAAAMALLDGNSGNVRTSRGGLGGLSSMPATDFWKSPNWASTSLVQFFLGLGRDFGNRTAVSDRLVDVRLRPAKPGWRASWSPSAEQRLGVGCRRNLREQRGRFRFRLAMRSAEAQGGVGNGQQGLNGSLVGSGEIVRY